MKKLDLKVPPVLVVFSTASIMWVGAWLFPSLHFQSSINGLLALIFALGGFIITLKGVTTFRKAETTTNPLEPDAASTLVSHGIYRYTRNPMYLGFAITLIGWGWYLSNWLSLLLSAIFMLYLTRFQIIPEERVLEQKFGKQFKDYKNKVRRWL